MTDAQKAQIKVIMTTSRTILKPTMDTAKNSPQRFERLNIVRIGYQ